MFVILKCNKAVFNKMKNIFIAFTEENLSLLLDGKKTSTLRSDKEYLKIGLQKGEIGFFRGFIVEYKGLVHVDEVGGKSEIWRSEAFDFTERKKPMFQSTEDFLEGKKKLHLYLFRKK